MSSVKKTLPSFQQNGSIYASLAVLALILILSALRIKFYGDPALSIAGNDTITYVEASQVPLFSAEIMTGRRLLTTNLLYKIYEPENGYEILVNGSIETTSRAFQPGFDRIAILQLAFSVFGWGLLAWFTAEQLRNPWLKFLSTLLILIFAYTPQMADWDSILMSESLTFSLFALQFGLLIKMVFTLYRNPGANITGWAVVWGIITFLWTFLRDTNMFTVLMTIGMIAILFLSGRYRKNKTLASAIVFLTLTFALSFYTSSTSIRSVIQLINIYKDDIFASPSRTGFFKNLNMPDPASSEYEAWLAEEGSLALMRFMLTHPGYPILKIARDFPHSFEEIKQTYFTARELEPLRGIALEIGNALHPENTTPFLLSILLLAGVLMLSVKFTDDSRPWAWLGLWLFFSSSLTLVPTILGDTLAINRHALYSTMIFRLMIWVFPIVLMDIALQKKSGESNS